MAPVDSQSLARTLERIAQGSMGHESWAAAHGLPAEACDRLLSWLRQPTLRSQAPVLALEAGSGQLMRMLVHAGLPAFFGLLSPALTAPFSSLWRKTQDQAHELLEQTFAKMQEQRSRTWWAGEASAATSAATPSATPLPGNVALPPTLPLVLAPSALPVATASVPAIVLSQVFHHTPSWEMLIAECARALAPGGLLVIANWCERDHDEPGYLSAVARTLWPDAISALPRSADLHRVLGQGGFAVEHASVYRTPKTLSSLKALGTQAEAFTELLAETSPSLVEMYDIDKESMTWRFMTMAAVKH